MNVITTDNALHLIGGALLAWTIWMDAMLGALGALVVFGWMREGAQHRDDGQWIGWITTHRLVEALSWAAGGAAFHAMRSI